MRDTGRSIFAFTAAAIGEYLRRIHRGKDIIIGVPFLNRISEADLRTVGCMTNMLPLRIPVDDALSMAELADQISAQVWELQARQRFAYGDIVTALQDGTEAFAAVRRDVLIPHDSRRRRGSAALEGLRRDSRRGTPLDAVNIVVRDHERDGSLEVDLFYADDVFDANYRFEDTLRHVLTLIERALDEPGVPVGDIDMLTTEDHSPPGCVRLRSADRCLISRELEDRPIWPRTHPVSTARWCQRAGLYAIRSSTPP